MARPIFRGYVSFRECTFLVGANLTNFRFPLVLGRGEHPKIIYSSNGLEDNYRLHEQELLQSLGGVPMH